MRRKVQRTEVMKGPELSAILIDFLLEELFLCFALCTWIFDKQDQSSIGKIRLQVWPAIVVDSFCITSHLVKCILTLIATRPCPSCAAQGSWESFL